MTDAREAQGDSAAESEGEGEVVLLGRGESLPRAAVVLSDGRSEPVEL